MSVLVGGGHEADRDDGRLDRERPSGLAIAWHARARGQDGSDVGGPEAPVREGPLQGRDEGLAAVAPLEVDDGGQLGGQAGRGGGRRGPQDGRRDRAQGEEADLGLGPRPDGPDGLGRPTGRGGDFSPATSGDFLMATGRR